MKREYAPYVFPDTPSIEGKPKEQPPVLPMQTAEEEAFSSQVDNIQAVVDKITKAKTLSALSTEVGNIWQIFGEGDWPDAFTGEAWGYPPQTIGGVDNVIWCTMTAGVLDNYVVGGKFYSGAGGVMHDVSGIAINANAAASYLRFLGDINTGVEIARLDATEEGHPSFRSNLYVRAVPAGGPYVNTRIILAADVITTIDGVFTGDGSGLTNLNLIPDVARLTPIETDFLNNTDVASYPWSSGAGADGTRTWGTAVDHPGYMIMSSSATANSGWYVCLVTTMVLLNGGEVSTHIFQMKTVTAQTLARHGFFKPIGAFATPTDGAWINVAGATVSGKTSAASAASTTASTYTLLVDTWYRGVVTVNADATLVTFELYTKVDGVMTSVWTDTLATNIPTAIIGQGSLVLFNGTTAAVRMWLDWLSLHSTKTLVR
jgi:hypothetical protein